MLSFPKLLFLVGILAAVWYGLRWFRRIERVGREERPKAPRSSRPRVEAEDMEKCPRCGIYVSPGSAGACGRPDCPYGR